MTTTDPTEHALIAELREHEHRASGLAERLRALPVNKNGWAEIHPTYAIQAANQLSQQASELLQADKDVQDYAERLEKNNEAYARLNDKCGLLEWENKGLRLQIEGLNEACKRHADDKKDLRAELRRLSEN